MLVAVLFGCFQMFRAISEALQEISTNLTARETTSFTGIDDVKEELLGIVEDTIANLQPPSAIDHLMGALAQFAQIKLMKSMDIDPSDLMPALEEVIPPSN